MTFNKKVALYDDNGNRISDYYEDIHISKDSDGRFAIVERNAEKGKEYTFIKEDGTLLCNEWFADVENFKKGDTGVKVRMWGGINAILLDTGKVIARNRGYKVESNLRNGLAIVSKKGKQNIINAKGNLVSKKWFHEIRETNIQGGYIWVMDEKDRSNCITTDGKMLFEKFVDYFRSWGEKYYVGICKETRMFIVVSKEDGRVVYTVKLNKDCTLNTFYYTNFLYVENEKNKCNLISYDTGKPIFKEWLDEIKHIEFEETCCFKAKNSDGTWSLYNSKGKKLTKQKCSHILIASYRDNQVKVAYYTKTKRRMQYILNVATGEKIKCTED